MEKRKTNEEKQASEQPAIYAPIEDIRYIEHIIDKLPRISKNSSQND